MFEEAGAAQGVGCTAAARRSDTSADGTVGDAWTRSAVARADTDGSVAPGSPPVPAPGVSEIHRWCAQLAVGEPDLAGAELVDRLRALEELKSAAAAAQARLAVALDVSQRQEQARARVPVGRRGQGVGAQVALARRESPARGGRLLGLAKALVTEMPHAFAALQDGRISEWRASLLVKESACLTREDRAVFDRELAANPVTLAGLGDKQLIASARKVAYRLDARAVVDRARRAPTERGVSLRPAPDTMTYLTALLPVAQGVGVLAALSRQADTLRVGGDERSRGQLMADTLVERITGQATAEAVPVEVQVVMTERALLAGKDEPAHVAGYGTVPAQWARDLIRHNLAGCAGMGRSDAGLGGDGPDAADSAVEREPGSQAVVWLRRLFTAPGSGQLVAMDSRRRIAPPGLAAFVTARDQTCRTPWCDAPIRHRDHIVAVTDGGQTTAANLQGLCEACNYAKTAPGWSGRSLTDEDDNGHVVETTTPTGHRYRSRAPAQPGHRPRPTLRSRLLPHVPRPGDSPLERWFIDFVRAA